MANLAQDPSLDRVRFGALLPREALILKTWLQQHGSEYTRIDTDVRVGPGQDPGPTFSDAQRQLWTKLTQHRIDAILYDTGGAVIVEVKDRADAQAIGQLILYGKLWQEENPKASAPRLLLLAASSQVGLEPALKTGSITLQLVPLSFSPLY